MIRLWLVLVLALANPVLAEPVRVTSGEHDGFTRLVFDYGTPVDWQVGRSADGYQLRLANKTVSYDLTAAFDLIGKSRLAAIWAAPDSGHIQIGLACACYAMPFEFRPGIIVVDLKDGPPPKGSSFETALDGGAAPPLAAQAALRPRPRPGSRGDVAEQAPRSVGRYDWTSDAYASLRSSAQPTRPPAPDPEITDALLPPDPGLQPLRDQILQEMSRGAAQGVVDMAQPAGVSVDLPTTEFPLAQIRIGEAPTSVNRQDSSVQGELGARGAVCITPDALDFASWGDESLPLADQMASLRSGLSGEFDKPEPEAVSRAIRFQLFLGFGAEARQMIAAFEMTRDEARVWRSLSYLVDSEPDPDGTFRGQAACDGPAALWAFLEDDTLSKGDVVDTGALRLAFTALPLHLRRLIGPRLGERFLALGDEETARAVSDAITRAPGDPGDAVSLMQAGLDLQNGDPAGAEKIAADVMADPGPNQPEALIALTEARIAQNLPMTPDVALALQALLTDHAGSDLEPRLREALVLAQAASGDFVAAFDGLKTSPSRQADVWALAAALAPDDAFLGFAVLEPTAAVPDVPDETAAGIARRLAGLGLGAAATQWLAAVSDPDPLLVAEAALRRADGRGALSPLAGSKGEVAQTMKLQALEIMGENLLRADILSAAGDLPAASAALARAGDWKRLAEDGEDPWKSLAARLPETPAPADTEPALPYGPLARGRDLAAAGAETRAAVTELLAAVPPPVASAAIKKTAQP